MSASTWAPWLESVHNALAQAGDVTVPLLICASVIYYWLGHRLWVLWFSAHLTLRRLPSLFRRYIQEQQLDAARSSDLLTGQLEVFSQRFKLEIDQGVKALEVAVMCAPLLGLLGTVSGMMVTFDSLGDTSLLSQASLGVAAGISEALFSTQLGLMISIPGLLVGRLLQRRQRQLDVKIDELCAQLLSSLHTTAQPSSAEGGAR